VLHLPYHELPVEDPGTPDQRSPMRYLAWLALQQKGALTLNALFGIGWMVAQALLWAAVGAAIDHGVVDRNTGELFLWVGVVMALGLFQAVCGALRHQLAVTNWMSATAPFRSSVDTSPQPARRSPTRSRRATWSIRSPPTP
jgi:hypothetical protein